MLMRDRRSFFVIFLFQAAPGFLVLMSVLFFFAFMQWGLPLFGNWIYAILNSLTTPKGIIVLLAFSVCVVLLFVALQTLCYYCAQRWLAYIFHKKKITLSFLLWQWRGVWSWIGTWLSLMACFVAFFVLSLAFLLLGMYIHESLVIVLFVLCFLGFIFLWIALYLSVPSYFLDDNKYFSAAKNSFSLIRTRWWKTFGYVFGALFLAAVVSLFFITFEKTIELSIYYIPETLTSLPAFNIVASLMYVLYAFIQLSINILVQIFLSAYSFQLYSVYKKN